MFGSKALLSQRSVSYSQLVHYTAKVQSEYACQEYTLNIRRERGGPTFRLISGVEEETSKLDCNFDYHTSKLKIHFQKKKH